MNKPEFVHLHNHTDYSLLESTIRIDGLIARTLEYGMSAVAITDSNNMCGTIEFYMKCREAGIKPIIGAEVSVTSVLSADEADTQAYKLVLLCMNQTGYRNLCRIVSAATAKGLQDISLVSPAILAAHNEGLICLSGGKDSELTALCRQGSDKALRVATWYDEHFVERYYIELFPEPTRDLATLSDIARTRKIPLVATADCRMLTPEDGRLYDVLQCIRTGKTLAEFDQKRRIEPCFHSPEVMDGMFGGCPEALTNTMKIADRCNLELPMDEYLLPHVETQDGRNADETLEQFALNGLNERMVIIRTMNPAMSHELEQRYHKRLRYELEYITARKLADYFLVVADYVNWAKNNGISVGPGRGSAGGSLVAYALRITDIDPMPHGLLFERFLNPERAMFPEIDLDFCTERREEVIHYIIEKYGRDRVCQLTTFGTFTDRGAIVDVSKVLGMSWSEITKMRRLLPQWRFNESLQETLARKPKLKINRLAERDHAVAGLLDISFRLSGLVRFVNVHAASIVITPSDIRDYMPVAGTPHSYLFVSHFRHRSVERIGLMRFCHLGLKNLTLNDYAVKLIRSGKYPELDLKLLPLDDKGVYELFASGNTDKVFQFESGAMKELLIKLRPSCFEDIVAACALFRPGPLKIGMFDDLIERKHGRKPITYILPELEPILANTYGVLVYQEQRMQIIQTVAGYRLGQADKLRRVLGRKDAAEVKKSKKYFLAGAEYLNFPRNKAGEVFELLCSEYAEYGFNKTHAVAYALIAYQSAWLKTHYPDEFAAAVERCNRRT